MRTQAIGTLAAATFLSACAAEQGIEFNSRQEQVCYERVSATLPGDKELRRSGSGTFVEVTIINNQMRDAEPSPEFEQCMVAQADPNSLTGLQNVTFTQAELVIWNGLTDAAKRDALIFIRNGGTLAEFVAQGA